MWIDPDAARATGDIDFLRPGLARIGRDEERDLIFLARGHVEDFGIGGIDRHRGNRAERIGIGKDDFVRVVGGHLHALH